MRVSDVFQMSLGAIGSNKLRSFLTLVGIVLGVASIIGVMTAISVMQTTIEKEMTVLGAQTFQVQKWPNGFNSDEQRRAAQKWPPVTLDEAQAIRDQVSSVDLVGTEIWDYGKVASYKGVTTEPNVTLCGGSPEYSENNTQFIGEGRNLSRMDMLASRRVAVLGNALALQLFPFTDPIGKTVLLDGRKFEVIGVFVKKVFGLRWALREHGPGSQRRLHADLRHDRSAGFPSIGQRDRAFEDAGAVAGRHRTVPPGAAQRAPPQAR